MVKIHSYEIYSKQLKDTLRHVNNFKSLLEQKLITIRQSGSQNRGPHYRSMGAAQTEGLQQAGSGGCEQGLRQGTQQAGMGGT